MFRYDRHFRPVGLLKMIKITELADVSLKVLSCTAILGAGGWAVWNFWLAGSTDWQSNLAIETQVLPYSGDKRLLVVHVKTKNPRTSTSN